jgi:hypothetical protein
MVMVLVIVQMKKRKGLALIAIKMAIKLEIALSLENLEKIDLKEVDLKAEEEAVEDEVEDKMITIDQMKPNQLDGVILAVEDGMINHLNQKEDGMKLQLNQLVDGMMYLKLNKKVMDGAALHHRNLLVMLGVKLHKKKKRLVTVGVPNKNRKTKMNQIKDGMLQSSNLIIKYKMLGVLPQYQNNKSQNRKLLMMPGAAKR